MYINYYLCPTVAYYSSFAPSMIHSMHHMIIILNIYINIGWPPKFPNAYLPKPKPNCLGSPIPFSLSETLPT